MMFTSIKNYKTVRVHVYLHAYMSRRNKCCELLLDDGGKRLCSDTEK